MILGLSVSAFILLHVLISLAGIVTGFVALGGMLQSSTFPRWTAAFLATTLLTSLTGFAFPVPGLDPARVLGILSLVVLAVALFALYGKRLTSGWRWAYVVSAVLALYFNVFVAVVQSFEKIGFLHELAPTQKEPPFGIAQGLVLLAFLVLGFLAVKRFHPAMGKT